MKVLALVTILFSLGACKTTEEIKREQMVSTLNQQVTEGQKLNATTMTRLQDLEQRLSQLTGNLEETAYSKEQKSEQLENLKFKVENLEKDQSILKKDLEDIRKLLEEITKRLSSQAKTAPVKKKSTSLPDYEQAMDLYGKARYNEAKKMLQELNGNKQLKATQRSRILHNLGMIAYMEKKYEQAAIYFSQLYTTYPKANQVPNGLLYLGRSFQNMNQLDDARDSFSELISKFPNSKQAGTAKNLLGKL